MMGVQHWQRLCSCIWRKCVKPWAPDLQKLLLGEQTCAPPHIISLARTNGTEIGMMTPPAYGMPRLCPCNNSLPGMEGFPVPWLAPKSNLNLLCLRHTRQAVESKGGLECLGGGSWLTSGLTERGPINCLAAHWPGLWGNESFFTWAHGLTLPCCSPRKKKRL